MRGSNLSALPAVGAMQEGGGEGISSRPLAPGPLPWIASGLTPSAGKLSQVQSEGGAQVRGQKEKTALPGQGGAKNTPPFTDKAQHQQASDPMGCFGV